MKKMMMKKKSRKIRFDVITIFPKIFDSYLKESLFKRGLENKIFDFKAWNLRDFSLDRHRKVDDRPFGGGPGMVMQVEPIFRAVQSIKGSTKKLKLRTKVVLFSTRGKELNSKIIKELSKFDQLILICGRYEGVDERVVKNIADLEISIGDYILSGGELPALILAESVLRFRPGFLGNKESLEDIKGSYPVYSQPRKFKVNARKSLKVPKVLFSGDHKKIDTWRKNF